MPQTRAIETLCSQATTEQTGTPSTQWPVVLMFVTVSLCVAFIEHLIVVPQLTAAAAKFTIAISAAVVGVAAYCLLSPAPTPKNFIFVSVPYLFVTFGFLCSADIPSHDSHDNHFPFFQYIAQTIATSAELPTWLPISGGIDIGLYHINYFPFLPHRLAGYLLYTFTPISTVTAYKFQLIIGVLLLSFGWYAVIAIITRSQHAAFWGAICVMMGGTGITFHQEQALATSHLLPWFVYCLLKTDKNRAYIFPAVALFGIGLSTHYPQIHLIVMTLAAMIILYRRRPIWTTLFSPSKSTIPLIVLLLILGSLPSAYIWRQSQELASGFDLVKISKCPAMRNITP